MAIKVDERLPVEFVDVYCTRDGLMNGFRDVINRRRHADYRQRFDLSQLSESDATDLQIDSNDSQGRYASMGEAVHELAVKL